MHDPKFEKVVQQRMEELEFTPSEVVWVNLQRGLHKEKRRRAPIFWLFFLLGGIMLGAGGASLFYFHRAPIRVSGAGSSSGTPATVTPATAIARPGSGTTKIAKAMSVPPMAAIPFMTAIPPTNRTSDSHPAMEGNRSATMISRRSPAAATGTDLRKQSEDITEPDATAVHAVPLTSTSSLLHPAAPESIASQLGRIRFSSVTPAWHDLSKYANDPAMAVAGATATKWVAKKARFSKGPVWEAGFAGGGGLSSAVLSQTPSDLTSGPNTLAQSLSSAASSARLQLRISKIQPDLSFWAGIFVQKPIMKRLSFDIGLNLHYYSTRLETGEKYSNNIAPSVASYFSASPFVQPAVQILPYYSSRNYKYSNHYYFLQLPVSIQWQFNRSRKIPLFWEGGLSLSRLISANALYYNEKSGIYYKDGGGASPNQLMAFSSLMVGLSWRGNLIKLGPEAQYGLTSLINANSAGSQHLFYGGIKITVMPKRW